MCVSEAPYIFRYKRVSAISEGICRYGYPPVLDPALQDTLLCRSLHFGMPRLLSESPCLSDQLQIPLPGSHASMQESRHSAQRPCQAEGMTSHRSLRILRVAEDLECPPSSRCTEESHSIIHHHMIRTLNAQRVCCSCKACLIWQHVWQITRPVLKNASISDS